MSGNAKDILVSCAIAAIVATVVSYKFAEMVYTIAGVSEHNAIGFSAPSGDEGGED